MAALVLLNAKVQLGSAWTGTAPGAPGSQTVSGTVTSPSDVSAYTTMVEVPFAIATKDWTNFGSGGYMLVTPGLKSTQFKFAFNQDFAAAALHSIIQTTLGGLGSLVYFDVMPTNAARSATNPSIVGAAYIDNYTPVVGKVGDLLVMSLQWPVTGAFTTLTV